MPISRRKFIALSGAAAGVCAVDLTAFADYQPFYPFFPRLGLVANSGDQTYPSENWPTYAKFNVIVIGGNWEIWGDGRAYTREDVVQGIKAASSISSKVFQYVAYNEIYPTGQGYDPADPNSFFATVNRNNWWLYENGTSGATVQDGAYGETYINMTHFSPVDPTTGLLPYQFAAKYSAGMYYSGNALHPRNAAPSLDGFFLDNVYSAPRADGDWNRDGTTDSHTNPTVQGWLRTGERDFHDEMLKIAPNIIVLANNGSWANLSTTDPTAISPLQYTFWGGLLEALIGASYSVETSAGFNEAMAYYEYLMETTNGTKLELVNQANLQTNGSDPYDSTPYHAMRYGLCLTLMNNGYYAGEGTYGHTDDPSQILWFDEYYGGDLLRQGYLQGPVSGSTGAVQTGPRWAYGPLGVWAREYAGGIAILNPKGNGPQTLTLSDLGGSLWKHINGTQDPATNNGQDVNGDITLADRDGIILLRR